MFSVSDMGYKYRGCVWPILHKILKKEYSAAKDESRDSAIERKRKDIVLP